MTEKLAELATPAPHTHRESDDTEIRLIVEADFHDRWAADVDVRAIDVQQVVHAETSPELRWIVQQLGNVQGKRILDLGCGLGEVATYLACRGASVVAADVSPGMLEVARRVASQHGTKIETHCIAAEKFELGTLERFDVIYMGNVWHHIDIEQSADAIFDALVPGGTIASWDPVAYNPLINVYRRMANEVRTDDERPMNRQDIRAITDRCDESQIRFFWLTTLSIFLWMYLVQRRDPNRERYWKVVIAESDRWKTWHRLLAGVDRLLMTCCPPLRYWCWNVVIIGHKADETGR
ncbi:MAG: class I SAM-dependent methyltransferase [Planctomycetota bacterium]